MTETLILAVSDTHGTLHQYLPVVPLDRVDAILFAGDGYDEAMATFARHGVSDRVYAVAGNCDGRPAFADCEVTLAGWPIWITHGDRWGVKDGYDTIAAEAQRRGARLVVFGHSHRAHHEVRDGLYLFNPGSPFAPRGDAGSTMGLIWLAPETARFDYFRFA
jgi:putative phosphoesterase